MVLQEAAQHDLGLGSEMKNLNSKMIECSARLRSENTNGNKDNRRKDLSRLLCLRYQYDIKIIR